MEKLEKFIEKRAEQAEFAAMMIPRYLDKPNAFLGSKNYTLEQAAEFKKDADKCRAVLNFLKLYNKKGVQQKYFHSLSGNIGTFVKVLQYGYGEALVIKLANGREYVAPKREFIPIV